MSSTPHSVQLFSHLYPDSDGFSFESRPLDEIDKQPSIYCHSEICEFIRERVIVTDKMFLFQTPLCRM